MAMIGTLALASPDIELWIFFCLLAFIPPGPSQPFCLVEPDPPEDAGPWQQPHQQDPGTAALAGGAQVERQQAQLAPSWQFQRWASSRGVTKMWLIFGRKCSSEFKPYRVAEAGEFGASGQRPLWGQSVAANLQTPGEASGPQPGQEPLPLCPSGPPSLPAGAPPSPHKPLKARLIIKSVQGPCLRWRSSNISGSCSWVRGTWSVRLTDRSMWHLQWCGC